MRSQPLQKSEVKVFFLEGQDTEVLGGGRECVSRGINCASLDLLSNEESNGALTEIGQIRPGSSFGLGCETGCQEIPVYTCIQPERFKILIATREKALLDYLYLNASPNDPDADWVDATRLQNLDSLNSKELKRTASVFDSKVGRMIDVLFAPGVNFQ